jgi:hypothetical protein
MDEYLNSLFNFSDNPARNMFAAELTQLIAKLLWKQKWHRDKEEFMQSKEMLEYYISSFIHTDFVGASGDAIDKFILKQVNFNHLWQAVQEMKKHGQS